MRWGNLELMFGYWDFATNTPTEQPRFLRYSYFSYQIELTPAALQNVTTDRGLSLGDPLARLIELYPDVEYLFVFIICVALSLILFGQARAAGREGDR